MSEHKLHRYETEDVIDTRMATANITKISADGPYVCTGEFTVAGARATGASVVLCRCGGSRNKPYCDGSHVEIDFRDSGLLPESAVTPSGATGGVTITPRPNGPLKLVGPLTLKGADGRTTSAGEAFLCRCGNSQNKPYCDGTHKEVGFAG